MINTFIKNIRSIEMRSNKPYDKARFENALSKGKLTPTISNKDIDEIVSKAKTKEEADIMILNKLKPSVKRIREKLSDTKKQLEDIKKMDNRIKTYPQDFIMNLGRHISKNISRIISI